MICNTTAYMLNPVLSRDHQIQCPCRTSPGSAAMLGGSLPLMKREGRREDAEGLHHMRAGRSKVNVGTYASLARAYGHRRAQQAVWAEDGGGALSRRSAESPAGSRAVGRSMPASAATLPRRLMRFREARAVAVSRRRIKDLPDVGAIPRTGRQPQRAQPF